MHNEFAIAAYFVAGTDIGRLTIKTIGDIRALNKNVHFRPACNLYNINELASLWEKKIGRTLPRVTISENDLLVAAAGLISFTIFFIYYHTEHVPVDARSVGNGTRLITRHKEHVFYYNQSFSL